MNPVCPVFRRCGGCALLDMDYAAQLEAKRRRLEALLGGLVKLEGIEPAEEPLRYRTKVHAVLGRSRSGLMAGTYAAGTHRIVDSRGCLIEDARCREALDAIVSVLRDFRVQPYDEDARRGLARHILIRRAAGTGEMLAVLVLARPELPGSGAMAKRIRERAPGLTTLVTDVNSRRTSQVLAGNFRTLYGPGFIFDRLCGLEFRLSPGAFYQVNHAQTEKLYALAREFAGGGGRLIDAYCGVGTLGLTMAADFGEVLGIEYSRSAVADARFNARRNGVGNARFAAADATEYLVSLASRGEKADVLVLDPPRAGSTPDFLKSAARLGPERIVYVSCCPETLARDAKLLASLGYKPRRLRAVDMFPQTEHIESVLLLERK